MFMIFNANATNHLNILPTPSLLKKKFKILTRRKKAFEKCLTTPGEPTKEEDDPFGDGELEALFAEDPTDTGKDKDTTDTATEPR